MEIMNELFGQTNKKDIDFKLEYVTGEWITTEYDIRYKSSQTDK